MARRGENIYKRKDGRYEGRYIKRYDLNGQAVYGYVYSRNYNEIKDKLAKIKSQQSQKVTGSNMLLSEWLNVWVESTNNVKETTQALYKRHIRNNIVPIIGKYQLKKLTADIVQSFVNCLNLSAATVKLVFVILKSALTSAEDKGYIKNIWSKIKLPKNDKREVMILTPSEQKRLEAVLTEGNDIGIWICLYTGLRIGELCALKWNDIDFVNGQIHINGTQSRIDGELKITPPKSQASKRSFPIPTIILEKLKQHKKYSEFVLSNHGQMVDVRSYRRRFKTLLKQANLPDIKFHALRHTFASRALEVGMDYKTLSEILGHASVSITMDLYVHSLNEYKKEQMNKLNALYSPSV